MSGIATAVMGVGHVGRALARAALDGRRLRLVGALDRDPAVVGRPLRDLLDGRATDVTVSDDREAVLAAVRGGVLLHATGQRLAEAAEEMLLALEAGVSIVSTCPELAYPWLHHAALAAALDRAAARAGVALLGTGVNPGFALDRLIVSAGAATGGVRRVRAVRRVDASNRRQALLAKAGVGLTADEFRARAGAGEIGFAGLDGSAALVALGLDLPCDAFEHAIEPALARAPWEGPVRVAAGHAAGVHQVARGLRAGEELIRLELTYAVGLDQAGDAISIEGDPPVDLVLAGGVSGQAPTAWSAVHAAAQLPALRPGLRTVLDLPSGRQAGARR